LEIEMAGASACVLDESHTTAQRLFEKGAFTITRCDACGLIMSGAPAEESAFDAPNYYTMSSDVRADIYAEWAFRWRWILRRIGRLARPGDLLDVGAGNGLFVKIAAEEFGWRARGIVLSKTEVDFARRALDVELDQARIEDVADSFDLVTTFNVLEHVEDPVAFLAGMRDRLRPGGLIAVTTPSPASIQARMKGLARWGMIAPPHHVNIFSRQALGLALRKAGFQAVSYDALSTYIRALRRLDGDGTMLRDMAFNALRLSGLGGDHLMVARRVDG
jgi:SAM-dependent methyltransferase